MSSRGGARGLMMTALSKHMHLSAPPQGHQLLRRAANYSAALHRKPNYPSVRSRISTVVYVQVHVVVIACSPSHGVIPAPPVHRRIFTVAYVCLCGIKSSKCNSSAAGPSITPPWCQLLRRACNKTCTVPLVARGVLLMHVLARRLAE